MKTTTVRILINRCYGGFGLSKRCVVALAVAQARCVKPYPYKVDEPYMVDATEFGAPAGWKVERMTNVVRRADGVLVYVPQEDAVRVDPDLIALFDAHGSEWVSGDSAKLAVKEVSLGWDVSDYDGMESVEVAGYVD